MFTVRDHPDLTALDPYVLSRAAAATGHPELADQIGEALNLGMPWYDLLNQVLTNGSKSFGNWFQNWKNVHGHGEPTMGTRPSAPTMPPPAQHNPKPETQGKPKQPDRHEPERGT